MQSDQFLAELPVEQRLALAYAPKSSRAAFLAVLALDGRLAGIVRASRESLLGQLRLAWWRDQLAKPAGDRAEGEPLLALIGEHFSGTEALAELASGWEGLLGDDAIDKTAFAALVEARAGAFVALGGVVDCQDDNAIAAAARIWACGDLAAKLGNPAERASVNALVAMQPARVPRLPKAMRSLAVLASLAQRQRGKDGVPLASGPGALATALRVGVIGF